MCGNYYGLAAFVVALDQLTKWLVVKNMELGERIPIFEPYFALLSHRNRGAAWGMLEGQMWFFYNCHDYRYNWDYLLFS